MANYLLAVGGRLRRQIPQTRDVRGKFFDGEQFALGERVRLISQKAIVVLFQASLFAQSFFPSMLQLGGNQPVRRVDGIVS
jgi:hypothetical protein